MMMSVGAFACARPAHAVGDLPKPATDLPAGKEGETRSVVLAAGCFWCTEAVFEQLKGVKEVVSGYAGGTKETATYEQTSTGTTGHAEAIRVTYDPSQISYGELLRVLFSVFDPTTKDRQGADAGHEYRSAIFFANDDEKRVAESYIKQLNDAKLFDAPIVTTVEPLTEFYPAEAYHQDYAKNHPNEGYIRGTSLPKVAKVREKFADEVK